MAPRNLSSNAAAPSSFLDSHPRVSIIMSSPWPLQLARSSRRCPLRCAELLALPCQPHAYYYALGNIDGMGWHGTALVSPGLRHDYVTVATGGPLYTHASASLQSKHTRTATKLWILLFWIPPPCTPPSPSKQASKQLHVSCPVGPICDLSKALASLPLPYSTWKISTSCGSSHNVCRRCDRSSSIVSQSNSDNGYRRLPQVGLRDTGDSHPRLLVLASAPVANVTIRDRDTATTLLILTQLRPQANF